MRMRPCSRVRFGQHCPVAALKASSSSTAHTVKTTVRNDMQNDCKILFRVTRLAVAAKRQVVYDDAQYVTKTGF